MEETHRTTIRLPHSLARRVQRVAKSWKCSRNTAFISLLQFALGRETQALFESAKQSPDSKNADSPLPFPGPGRGSNRVT